jgi:tetratricopeptide (TPR) repeat protein
MGGLLFFVRKTGARKLLSLRIPYNCATKRRYNRRWRMRFLTAFLLLLTTILWAQDSANKTASDQPPTSNHEAGASSSRDTLIDISPPKDDAKNHPNSKDVAAEPDDTDNPDASGIQEFHPWSPMKAMKDIEVGDFYSKRKSYKAALERYKDALLYKPGDAVAISRVAACEEKLGDKAEARKYYEQYLKILPDGPFAKEARASLEKLPKTQ